MAELKYEIVDAQGKKVGSVDLNPAVFDVDTDNGVIHSVVRWQRNKKRAGTHSTKNLSMMDNNKKKPFKQKGTGNARRGSNLSPLMVGGAVAHGPKPRSYEFSLNKKVRATALAAALTEKFRTKQLILVDKFEFSAPKTKVAAASLGKMGVSGKALVINGAEKATDAALTRAAQNIAGVKLMPATAVNVYDLLKVKYLVCPAGYLEALQNKVLKQIGA